MADGDVEKDAIDAAKACLASLSATLTFPIPLLLVILASIVHATADRAGTIGIFGIELSRYAAVGAVTVAIFASFIHAARLVLIVRTVRAALPATSHSRFDQVVGYAAGWSNPFAVACDPRTFDAQRLLWSVRPNPASPLRRLLGVDSPLNARLMRPIDRLVSAWPRLQVGAILAAPIVLVFTLIGDDAFGLTYLINAFSSRRC